MTSEKQFELICNLQLQEKMLSKQAQREEKNANKERNTAKRHLAKGERNFAQLHATNSIRSYQHAQFLRENAARISQMVADLKLADVQARMAKSLNTACKEMEKCINSMDLEKIAQMTMKYDQLRGKTQAAHELTAPETDCDTLGASLLDDLEQEITIENQSNQVEIPSMPTTVNPIHNPTGEAQAS
ncbi:Charged multivesicular body protein 1b [Tritrichomonas musculus]|uniref:Charged multivesicular body protein 1b n=1 Tax=Tritrichomonas musculus TaxID=1915356 RepID=A0ABR2K398_9EUKA